MPSWWRGEAPAEPRPSAALVLRGDVEDLDLRTLDRSGGDGLAHVSLREARLRGLDLCLDDTKLTVWWSQLEDCRLTQRARPVANARGCTAQGTLGAGPSLYRGCRFERVRFRTTTGFSMGAATFEGCEFVHCRWEGSRAWSADLVDCRFTGRMDGAVWFGTDRRTGRRNVVRGNDFSGVTFTDNVGWRFDFPVDDQLWPSGYAPVPRS